MKDHRSMFSVEMMARVLEVSRSGFHAWEKRPESVRSRERRLFDVQVRAAFEQSKGRYGSEKVRQALAGKGRSCSRKRVAESMRRQGLRSKIMRKFRVTTDSKHSYPVAPNLLNRKFSASAPNRVWVSDITYLWTGSGWLYLVVFIDLYSRRVVGWYVSPSLGHETVLAALYRAVWRRRPGKGLIIHSDRGVQYCCDGFRKAIKKLGFVQSMSRKGNCWDNAVAESFFKILKSELIYHITLTNGKEAREILFEYIERDYNGNRIHGTLGYLTPIAFESVKVAKVA